MKGISLGLLAGSATALGDSHVSKVMDLLGGLKDKVAADLKAEATLMEEYNSWADEQKTVTSYAIKDENRVIEESSAGIEGASAKIEQFSAEIDDLGPAIAGKQAELGKAEAVRKDENTAFVAKEKELVEAEDMLRRASSIIKRAMTNGNNAGAGGAALLQQNSDLKNVVKALGAIVDASWMDSASAGKLKAFVEEDDLSLTQAPQAAAYNYESKSAGIVDVIENLRDEVVENLRKSRNAETSSRHAYELLVQSLNNEVATLSKQISAAQGNKAAAGEALGASQGELKSTQEALAADEAYLAQITEAQAAKNSEWSSRQQEAADEMAVLQEAHDILSSRVSVFAQTGASVSRQSSIDLEKRDKIVSLLRRMGHKFNSFGLLQAASSAQADPFGKIRGLIADMVAKLEQQAREESDHKEMCDSELSKNNQKKAKKLAQLEKYSTRLDKATARVSTLKGEIVELQAEIKALDQAVAEGIKMRNEEHADNTQTITDNKDSSVAVADAIKVLKEYYGAEALAQLPQPTFSGKQSDASHSIIAVLETAQQDFTKVYMETEAAEAEAAEAHEKFLQESAVTKAKKQAGIVGKKSEVETLGVTTNQLNDDITNTQSELEAVVATLSTLHKQCANVAMSCEERKRRRDAEIAGLQEALEILAPEEGASLIQKRGFLA